MNMKKLTSAGIASCSFSSPNKDRVSNQVFADTNTVFSSQKAKASVDLTSKQVVKLAADFAKAASYVQSGGAYKEGEYKTFTYKGMQYRYLSKDIDTSKELLRYIKKTLTHHAAEKFIKDHGIITHKGKLAQLEADGGSLLQWDKAEAQFVTQDKSVKVFRLVVPVGENWNKRSLYHKVPLLSYNWLEVGQ